MGKKEIKIPAKITITSIEKIKIFSISKNLKKLKEKNSEINKIGFWGNDEIIDLYTCRFLKKVFGFRWRFLIPFIKNRNQSQICNKIRNFKNKIDLMISQMKEEFNFEITKPMKLTNEFYDNYRLLIANFIGKFSKKENMLREEKFEKISLKLKALNESQKFKENLNFNFEGNFTEKNNIIPKVLLFYRKKKLIRLLE